MALTRNTNQRNTSWNAPYTFSGKEKDAETGYGYFGARYYDSGLSIWLSVDPMSDKYPSMSPYNYCANNPVILVDPDGNSIIHPIAGRSFMLNCGTAYTNIQSNRTYQSLVSGFKDSRTQHLYFTYTLLDAYGSTRTTGYSETKTQDGHSTTTKYTETLITMSSYINQTEIGQVKTLLHEAVHGNDDFNGRTIPQSHEGFDQQKVLNGLLEYNQTNNKGFTFDQLETISWSGCQESPEFEQYIRGKAEQNNITYEQQLQNWGKEVKAICNKPE